MELKRKHLEAAEQKGLLNAGQLEPLWSFLNEQPEEVARFKGSHILFYFGGLLAIGAMSLFMTLAWSESGGMGIIILSVIYGICSCLIADMLLWKMHQPIPAGLLATLAVVMIPLAIFGIQETLHLWEDDYTSANYHDFHQYIDSRWLVMEIGTLIGGGLLFWRYKLPFMVMPIAVTLWYMSMDLTPFLTHMLMKVQVEFYDDYWSLRYKVSAVIGLLMLVFAFAIDLKTRHIRDYAWWLYLFGLMAFWGGLSLQHSDSEWAKFGYCILNLGLITFGGLIGRRVFAVFGGFGVAGYLGYLSWNLFKDSLMFPLVVTLIGLVLIAVGIIWQKTEAKVQQKIEPYLPDSIRRLLQHR